MEEKKPLYTPEDIAGLDYRRDLGYPGEYPFTRGVQPDMYRGRTWTMRQFAGFGTAVETNRRFHFLLDRGQTGLSVAFDMPTIMGYDSDHPLAEGEVGRCGVAIDSLADMETLFDGIPLRDITTSMTINGPAAVLLAFYLCVGEKQGAAWKELGGTIQNDILKEYIAQKSWIFPPAPVHAHHHRHPGLLLGRGAALEHHQHQRLPHPRGGLHRRAGTGLHPGRRLRLRRGGHRRGPRGGRFRPAPLLLLQRPHRLLRGDRQVPGRPPHLGPAHAGAGTGRRDPRSWALRFHTQTAGCSLTAQQPENNIVRTAFEALAAVLGGTQSLHTNSMDESLALPTEQAVEIALRTQQIIADETGVTGTIDPLAGSYCVEALTNRMEEEAEEYFRRIDELGGVLAAIEHGFFQREIADAAYRYQMEVEKGERIVVGVNRYERAGEGLGIDILKVDPEVERRQRQQVAAVRAERGAEAASRALEELKKGRGGRRQPHAADHRLRPRPGHRGRDRRGPEGGLRRLPGKSRLLRSRKNGKKAARPHRQARAGRPRPRRQSGGPRPGATRASRSSTAGCTRPPSRSWRRPCRKTWKRWASPSSRGPT